MRNNFLKLWWNEVRILEARTGIATCHYFLGQYDVADSLAVAMLTENQSFTEDLRLGMSILTRARFEARTIRFLISRARILRAIFIFIIAGILLIITLRKRIGRLLFT